MHGSAGQANKLCSDPAAVWLEASTGMPPIGTAQPENDPAVPSPKRPNMHSTPPPPSWALLRMGCYFLPVSIADSILHPLQPVEIPQLSLIPWLCPSQGFHEVSRDRLVQQKRPSGLIHPCHRLLNTNRVCDPDVESHRKTRLTFHPRVS